MGQIETDNINRMITITEFTKMHSVLYVLNKTWYIGSHNQDPKEHLYVRLAEIKLYFKSFFDRENLSVKNEKIYKFKMKFHYC